MTTWWGILITGGVFVFILGVYDRINNRRFEKQKQSGTIKLDDAQYKQLQAQTEATQTSTMTAVGAFWQGQFSEVTKQLEIEQDWRKRMSARLRKHHEWDYELLDHLSPEQRAQVGNPPSLDPDDPDDHE